MHNSIAAGVTLRNEAVWLRARHCEMRQFRGFARPRRRVYLPLTMFRKDARTARNRPQWRPSMALKVELKPHEQVIIGSCVITNTEQRAKLLIQGEKIPILREKDILTPASADTPAKLIYLSVQLMYLAPDPMLHHPTYFALIRDVLNIMPSAWPFIEEINNH